jgi:16S rRNA (guanine527-N7)-methyltransferase
MADVSRETAPDPDPAVAAAVFAPERLPLLQRYADLLVDAGVVRGLIGPREVERLWDRHLVNCGLLAPLLPEGARVVDLGSGAGLPGLVLAAARPDLSVTLVEPMLRRTTFLTEAVEILGLEQVTVVRGRAEEWSGPERFEVATARALAPLGRLLGWALPMLERTGCLLAMKGSSAAREIDDARGELSRWGGRAEVHELAVPGATPTTVVRVVPAGGPGIGWRSPSRSRRRGRNAQ